MPRTVCDEVFWRSDGASFPVEYTTTPISEGETLTGALVVFRDITERRRIETELERLNTALAEQARRDPLTGLGNRLRLEEDLAIYDARRVRYGHSYCVLLCDLDHFKALNDRQGHQAGDSVLCAVADALGRESRTSDAVYRFGGEELLVLLAEQTLEGALIVCERMREAVHALGLAHADNEAGRGDHQHRRRGLPAGRSDQPDGRHQAGRPRPLRRQGAGPQLRGRRPLASRDRGLTVSSRPMRVRDAMTEEVLTIAPDRSLRDAAQFMTEHNVGAAVIVDPEQPGPGIVTERDVVRSLGAGQDPDGEHIRDHLTSRATFADADWDLEKAADAMAKGGFRHLVVIENGQVAGIISMRDIIHVWRPR